MRSKALLYSMCGPETCSINTPWEHVKDADPQHLGIQSQTYESELVPAHDPLRIPVHHEVCKILVDQVRDLDCLALVRCGCCR